MLICFAYALFPIYVYDDVQNGFVIFPLPTHCIRTFVYLNRLHGSQSPFFILCFQSSYLLCTDTLTILFLSFSGRSKSSAEEASGSSKKYSKLSEQERKHWEDEHKKHKAIEKAAGLAPPQVKKPKPTKSMHGAPSKMPRKVSPNIYANKSVYYLNTVQTL